jgi:MoaA/NifB/PqqE/SkfB family radical SAM enzyme
MLKNTFCSSPWYSLRLEHDGNLHFCRWAKGVDSQHNIQNTSIITYFNSSQLRDIRQTLLNGEPVAACQLCYDQDTPEINMTSGRKKQLCKSAVDLQNFDTSFMASPHYKDWEYSYHNAGAANSQLADLQIDLGSYCNSECVMCSPKFSTKLYSTFKKLNWLAPEHPLHQGEYQQINDWTQNEDTLNRTVKEIGELTELRYIHFLGGETLIIPAFYRILNKLVEMGINKHITVGFTTNGTVWREDLVELLKQFQGVDLGISIETTAPVNNYIRYPGDVDQIKNNILKFKMLSVKNPSVRLQLRITPSALSIWHFDQLIDFQMRYKMSAESCHIIDRPEWLKLTVLPTDLRNSAADRLQAALDRHGLSSADISHNPNVRSSELLKSTIAQNAIGLINVLRQDYQEPVDTRLKLVQFLKQLESIRHNRILDYIPEYEEFLREYGY